MCSVISNFGSCLLFLLFYFSFIFHLLLVLDDLNTHTNILSLIIIIIISVTLELASEVLVQNGATKVCALVSHAVLSEGSLERIKASKLTELIVTNSIPLR